jgi:hypothetical protein
MQKGNEPHAGGPHAGMGNGPGRVSGLGFRDAWPCDTSLSGFDDVDLSASWDSSVSMMSGITFDEIMAQVHVHAKPVV